MVDRVLLVEVLADRCDDRVAPAHRVDSAITIGGELGLVGEQRGEFIPSLLIDALAVARLQSFDLVESDQRVEIHAHALALAFLSRSRAPTASATGLTTLALPRPNARILA